MNAEELATRLDAKRDGKGWKARCPAHDDHDPSLGIDEAPDGRALVHCRAGCDQKAVIEALRARGLWNPEPRTFGRRRKRGRIVATYDYTDPAGQLLFQVVRFDPKDFRQRRPDPDKPGAWTWNLNGQERVLYRLPDVLQAKTAGRVVFVTEGEKDVESLAALGLCATCNPGGAGKWKATYTESLAGARVIVIADRDEPGRRHAALVTRALTGKAESVRVIELRDRDGHAVKDPADFIAAGGTAEELREIVRTAPEWKPPEEPPAAAPTASRVDGVSVESIRATLWAISQEKIGATEAHRKTAAAVVEWLHARGRFYHDAARADFAGVMYFDTERKLLLPVQSDAFLAWLSDCLAVNRSERGFSFVASACETEGLSGRATAIEPATYWAARPGAVYLSNGPGRMAKVTAAGVELVDNGTDGILFPVGACLEPWAHVGPVDPFETCALFRDIAAAAPHGPLLFQLWAIALPTDGKTKPPACVTAPVGGGKTALVRGLFALLGMPETVNAVSKNGEGDFWAAVDAGGLVCFDNVDTRVDWLPDALAAAATAGTFTKRRLYTDADRVTLRARASIAVTSANPAFASDAGLADRLLVVRMNRRTGETAESALFDEVRANRDAGLSWIAETLAKALADVAPVPSELNARHPDFATLAVRIGRAMGREAEAVNALRAAEADKGRLNIENDWIGAALLELLSNGELFTGTAGELLDALKDADPTLEGKLSAKSLGKRLSKLWPHLQSVFHAEMETDRTRARRYTFHPPHAEFAEFQTAFSEKSYTRENIESFTRSAPESLQSLHLTPEPSELDFSTPDYEEGTI